MDLRCIIFWRKGEDFPEVFDAWDHIDADESNPEGFDKKVEGARQEGPVRLLDVHVDLDLETLFLNDKIKGTAKLSEKQ